MHQNRVKQRPCHFRNLCDLQGIRPHDQNIANRHSRSRAPCPGLLDQRDQFKPKGPSREGKTFHQQDIGLAGFKRRQAGRQTPRPPGIIDDLPRIRINHGGKRRIRRPRRGQLHPRQTWGRVTFQGGNAPLYKGDIKSSLNTGHGNSLSANAMADPQHMLHMKQQSGLIDHIDPCVAGPSGVFNCIIWGTPVGSKVNR